jgi:heat shock protein HslJ
MGFQENSVAAFVLMEDGQGGTGLMLTDKGMPTQHRAEVIAGWVSTCSATWHKKDRASIWYNLRLRLSPPIYGNRHPRSYIMKKAFIFTLLVTTLLLTACAAAPDYELTGVVWKWESTQQYDGDLINSRNPELYTLEFMEDGTAAIKADCNNATTTYTVDGSKLSFGPIASTLMACPEGSLSDIYLAQLRTAESYSFLKDGGLLINISDNISKMEFTQ